MKQLSRQLKAFHELPLREPWGEGLLTSPVF